MPSPDLITEELLDAIAQVESRNDPHAVGDRGLRFPAYGAYQMREPAFRDVQRFRPQAAHGVDTLASILGHPDRQRQLARAYLSVIDQDYGVDTVEDLLAAYNAGIGTVRKRRVPASTQAYVHRVLQLLQQP